MTVRKKKELYDATMNLGVETIARGHSARFLREEFIRVVHAAPSEGFPERVLRYFKSLATGPKRYRCWVLTEGVKRHLATSLPGDIGLQVGRPNPIPPGAPEVFYNRVPKSGICLSVETMAADPEAARLGAERRLGQVFAGLCLFNIDDHIGLKQTSVLVVSEESDSAILVERRRPGSHHLGSYETRQDRAEMLFRVQGRLPSSDSAQLSAAVQYHRLALLATSDEAQLVNLWIALEALCQGGAGSIIERVCTRVASCVAVDNLRKNLVSLAQYVRALWDDSDRNQFLRLFPRSSATRLAPEDLLAVLLKPDEHQELKELCRLCSKHPLILHRLFRTRSMGLAEPKDVAANLRYSRQNVEWQIRRIYRVRNAIVHRGQGDMLLPQLTQHLHSYLVKTIRSILLELDGQPNWTIRDALEHRRRLFEHVTSYFSDTAGHEIALASLLNPRETLLPQRAPFAWSPPPPSTTADSAGQRENA